MIQHFRHASIGIPAGKRLFTPFNIIPRLKPTRVFYHKNAALKKAVSYWRQPIITVLEWMTHYRKLVPGEADYIGCLDASGVKRGWYMAQRRIIYSTDCVACGMARRHPSTIKHQSQPSRRHNKLIFGNGGIITWMVCTWRLRHINKVEKFTNRVL